MDVPDDYGWVIFIEILIAFQLTLFTYVFVSPSRLKTFTPRFMKENFTEEFIEAFHREPDFQGYPDTGSGRFSKKLPLKDWYDFNNAQRIQWNYLEGAHAPLVCIPIAGLEFPYWTIGLGAAYIIGRTVYSIGYKMSGSRGRGIGAAILDISLLGLLIVAFVSCFYMVYD
ncbi:unnamed protein product [Blepharisma stoltei]|uniref:MAPEG family protein n=1 Tax=Blepharisma stoltei TaxID=1481888 RepID=A0AAU9JEW7_9CILI|nr:unnamed protein product [Blepharisma stoltei]